MEDGRIPRDVLYGKVSSDARCILHPALRFRDACKRDMKSALIGFESWESAAADLSAIGVSLYGVVSGRQKKEEMNFGWRRDHQLPCPTSCCLHLYYL